MSRQWSDPLVMALFGALSIGAVVGARQFFSPPTPAHPAQATRDAEQESRRLRESVDVQTRRLAELEATVKDLGKRDTAASSPSQPASIIPTPAPAPAHVQVGIVEEALSRAQGYIAKDHFDTTEHSLVLADLNVAYDVKGLSPRDNRSLKAAIEAVNNLGLATVVSATQYLRPEDRAERLREFLKNTPRLTADQSKRIQALLTESDQSRHQQ